MDVSCASDTAPNRMWHTFSHLNPVLLELCIYLQHLKSILGAILENVAFPSTISGVTKLWALKEY